MIWARMACVHLTYADNNFTQAAFLLKKSARRHGVLDSRVYAPSDAPLVEARRLHPEIMSSQRGAGYWLWKPFIILDVLRSVPDGTVVLYTDSAMTFIADPGKLLSLGQDHPVCLFHMIGRLQGEWTKRDCFVEMGADAEEFWSLPQLMGGIQLYRAGPEARDFVSSLIAAMASKSTIADATNIHGLPNLPGFKDHRHDQSVLTILAKQRGAAIFPDPSQFGPWSTRGVQAPFGQVFYLHRQRNRSFFHSGSTV